MLYWVLIYLSIGIADSLRLTSFGDLPAHTRLRTIETLLGRTLLHEKLGDKISNFSDISSGITQSIGYNDTSIYPELVCIFISGSSLTNEDKLLSYFENYYRYMVNFSQSKLNTKLFVIHDHCDQSHKKHIQEINLRLQRQAAYNVAQEQKYIEKSRKLDIVIEIPVRIIFKYNNGSFNRDDIKTCRLLARSITVSNSSSQITSALVFDSYSKDTTRISTIPNAQIIHSFINRYDSFQCSSNRIMLEIGKFDNRLKQLSSIKDIVSFLNFTFNNSFNPESKSDSFLFKPQINTQQFYLFQQLLSPLFHRYVELSQGLAIRSFNEMIAQRHTLYSKGWLEALYNAREQCLKRFDALITDLDDFLADKFSNLKNRRLLNRFMQGRDANAVYTLKSIMHEEYVHYSRLQLISVIDDFLLSRIASAKVAWVLPRRNFPTLNIAIHTFFPHPFGKSVCNQNCLLQGPYSNSSNRIVDLNGDCLVWSRYMNNENVLQKYPSLSVKFANELSEGLSRSLISLGKPLSQRTGSGKRVPMFPTIHFLKRILGTNIIDKK